METTAAETRASKEADANNARPLHLSFAAFSHGCQAYVGRNGDRSGSSNPSAYAHGWKWLQHDQVPQLSHLSRNLILPLRFEGDDQDGQQSPRSQPADVEQDPTVFLPLSKQQQHHQNAHVRQSILYSATWHVPVLWIDGWVGTTSQETVRGLTIGDVICKADTNTLAPLIKGDTANQRAYFPPVTLSDHPTYNCAAIFLHPCQTAQVVGEMLGDSAPAEASEEVIAEFGRRYLEAFIAVCASAVDMRGEA